MPLRGLANQHRGLRAGPRGPWGKDFVVLFEVFLSVESKLRWLSRRLLIEVDSSYMIVG
jgi:hypothetical protein